MDKFATGQIMLTVVTHQLNQKNQSNQNNPSNQRSQLNQKNQASISINVLLIAKQKLPCGNGGGCWGCWKECKNAPEPAPECQDGEQKAHDDCTKYYSCQDGTFVEQSCAWGLRYHAEDQKCTFMFLVDC